MLYDKSRAKILSGELFQNPPAEYRGAPFWAWNCELDKDVLKRQISYFEEMGFGGFFMHSRTGLATDYLGDEFFEDIKECVKTAKDKQMKAYLYDEDRWPSGYAGGIVTKEKNFRARHLLFTPFANKEDENRRLLAVYGVLLDSKGCLKDYVSGPKMPEPYRKWFAYLEIAKESPGYNNETYVDTLNKQAIDRFKEVTYERYKQELKQDFGTAAPGIFTDEPQFTKKTVLKFPWEENDVILPFTDDFPDTFQKAYGHDLMARFPELIWDLPKDQVSEVRYQYHAHVLERFAGAYADNLGNWCQENGCLFTGHMMEEPTLRSQTAALGEVMRSLGSFGIPGVDMLCDRREYSTVKQAQSVARQYDKEGVMTEAYGVTNWDFDFRRHKMQGDWQAALGVTLRVPHLSWVSMEGEAKRDYPASFNYQVPWYQRYKIIEDHFARVNTAMTRGKAIVRVAVLHPIESYWLHWGPEESTAEIRKQLEDNFKNITEWLLFGQIDFDYISEALLESHRSKEPSLPGRLSAYEVIVVPSCETIRSHTYHRLLQWKEAGGKLIFIEDTPKYIDAKADKRCSRLKREGSVIPFNRYRILKELKICRDIDIYLDSGVRADNLLYQLRQDGENRFLFIAHGKFPRASEESDGLMARDVMAPENIQICVHGTYKATLYDTLTGKTKKIKCRYIVEEETWISYSLYGHDSLLLLLEPGLSEAGEGMEKPLAPYRLGRVTFDKEDAPTEFWEKVPVTLAEPNVFLLDLAEYALDDEEFSKEEEILRLDNEIRRRLGYPLRQDGMVQPWVVEKESAMHKVSLRFTIKSDIYLEYLHLGIENRSDTVIIFNGKEVMDPPDGYYVDEKIPTVLLKDLLKGNNELELHIPVGKRTNVEACYLLGDFGVLVQGSRKKIISPVRELSFGDVTSQGLPFYGGNISYHIPVQVKGNSLIVRSPMYRGALIDVEIDGVYQGYIVFAPYQLEITDLAPGLHTVTLTIYGNRVNTFGSVHNCSEHWWWHGPDAYRVFRDEFSYGYHLKQTGILKSPEIFEDCSYQK